MSQIPPDVARYLNDDPYDKKIVSFKTFMSDVPEPIIDIYEVPSRHTPEKWAYSYVPESHRAHIKTIIDFFYDLHNHGLSLDDFEESNVVYHRGEKKLKFRGLEIVQRLQDKDRAKDLRLLHNAIKDLILKYNFNNYTIPTPIVDLLSYIQDYRDFEDDRHARIEYILRDHLGVQTHDTSVRLMKNYHEIPYTMHDRNEKASYNKSLREMNRRDDYEADWTEWFSDPHCDPQVGPLGDCFNYKHESNDEGYIPYVGVGTNQVVNQKMIKFWRHSAVHLPEHWNKHTTSKITIKDIDLTIMAFFDDELLSFQKRTFKNRISDHFFPDSQSPVSAGQREGSTPDSVEWERPNSRQNPTRRRLLPS